MAMSPVVTPLVLITFFILGVILLVIYLPKPCDIIQEYFIGGNPQCPNASRPFLTPEGYTHCCKGAVEGDRCLGTVLCTMSEDQGKIPMCPRDNRFWIKMAKDASMRVKSLYVLPRYIASYYYGTAVIEQERWKKEHPGPYNDWKSYLNFTIDNQDRIKNLTTNMCFDLFGLTNGTRVVLYNCHGGPNQKWSYDPKTLQIKSKAVPGKCMQLQGSIKHFPNLIDLQANTDLMLYDCSDSPYQKFSFELPQ